MAGIGEIQVRIAVTVTAGTRRSAEPGTSSPAPGRTELFAIPVEAREECPRVEIERVTDAIRDPDSGAGSDWANIDPTEVLTATQPGDARVGRDGCL